MLLQGQKNNFIFYLAHHWLLRRDQRSPVTKVCFHTDFKYLLGFYNVFVFILSFFVLNSFLFLFIWIINSFKIIFIFENFIILDSFFVRYILIRLINHIALERL